MHDGHTQDAEKLESITNLKHAPENMLIYSNNMAPKNFENELRKRCEFRKFGTTSANDRVLKSENFFLQNQAF